MTPRRNLVLAIAIAAATCVGVGVHWTLTSWPTRPPTLPPPRLPTRPPLPRAPPPRSGWRPPCRCRATTNRCSSPFRAWSAWGSGSRTPNADDQGLRRPRRRPRVAWPPGHPGGARSLPGHRRAGRPVPRPAAGVRRAGFGGRRTGAHGALRPPVPMGVSTGHTRSTAGTIGAVVTDGERRYALSTGTCSCRAARDGWATFSCSRDPSMAARIRGMRSAR